MRLDEVMDNGSRRGVSETTRAGGKRLVGMPARLTSAT